MFRSLTVTLVLGLITAGGAPDQRTAPEGAIPELVVSLAPARGFVPLDAADRLAPYRFQVTAIDREHDYFYGSAETLVRPGQSRSVERGSAARRIRASVELLDGGLVNYKAELLVDGKPVARTSAEVRVQGSK